MALRMSFDPRFGGNSRQGLCLGGRCGTSIQAVGQKVISVSVLHHPENDQRTHINAVHMNIIEKNNCCFFSRYHNHFKTTSSER